MRRPIFHHLQARFRPILKNFNCGLLAAAIAALANPATAGPRPEPGPRLFATPLSTAPGYCASSGGDTSYESISSVIVTPNPSGTYKLSVKVFIANPTGCAAGNPCPEYDSSPEYVNVWIDFNGDKQWDASEQVLDAALTGYQNISYSGFMEAVTQFSVPGDVTKDPTWVRANLGWSFDPNNPCEFAWTWGNVVDDQIQFQGPEIKSISVKGVNTPGNYPQTGGKAQLEAEINIPTGYEITKCSWTGDLTAGEGDKTQKCRYEYIPATGHGPKKETYGSKKVTLTLTYQHTAFGSTGQTSKDYDYKVFFAKDSDDNGDSTPNWFEYWKDDGAVAELNATDVVFDPTKGAGSYGAWSSSSGKVELGAAAANVHYPDEINVPAKTNCPGGKFGGAKGIDSVAEVITHERQHETFYTNWNGGSPIWVVGTTKDSDDPTPNNKKDIKGDQLPDDYETGVTKTDPNKLDSCDLKTIKSSVYQWYGDEEFRCMQVSHGKTGVADKDWANPGKQAAPTVTTALAVKSVALMSAAVAEVVRASGPVDVGAQPEGGIIRNEGGGFAVIAGNYSDQGVAADGDGKYDYLALSVDLQVDDPGLYTVVAWLKDPHGNYVAWANAQGELSAGPQTVILQFDGEIIRTAGLAGPYTVSNIELRVDDSELLVESLADVYVTAAYTSTDFDPLAASLAKSFSDVGVDANGNGLFDMLRVNVGLNVTAAGVYAVIGELEGKDIIAVANKTVELAPGVQNVSLDFDGRAIFQNQEDSPYYLRRLRIEDAAGERLDFLGSAHEIQGYSHTQFEHEGRWIAAAGFADQGIDLDGDGKFDYLRIAVPLGGSGMGGYTLSADLESSEGVTLGSAKTTIDSVAAGMATLDFAGASIFEQKVDGPYQVTRITLLNQEGDIADYRSVGYATKSYSYTDFGMPLVSLVGSIQDAGVDLNGNGKYDQLIIRVGVVAAKTGVVFANARLVDSKNQDIEWTSAQASAPAGQPQFIDLLFEGESIGANGVDGPYQVRDLNVYSALDPNQNVYLEQAHVTAPYSYRSFEGSEDCAADVSPQTQVDRGGFRYNRRTGRYLQQVTVRNTGAAPMPGPVSLTLDGLSGNIALQDANGTTACAAPLGSAYINLSIGADDSLSPGEQVEIWLQFTNPANQPINYNPRILAGGGDR